MTDGAWEFWDYVEADGTSPFARWLSCLDPAAQAHIDTRMLAMEALATWPEKWASRYRGTEGLFELRMPFNRVQYRPLYMHHPRRRRCLVILVGTIEKGSKLPQSDVTTAVRRRATILKEPDRAIRHRYD